MRIEMISLYRETRLSFGHSWIFKANLHFQGVERCGKWKAVMGSVLSDAFLRHASAHGPSCLADPHCRLHVRGTSPHSAVARCSALSLQQKALSRKCKVQLCLLHVCDTLSLARACSHSHQLG